jgi:RNA polymerase sigma-70 factor (ECF subfamily)
MITLFSQAPAEELPPPPEAPPDGGAPADEAGLVRDTLGANPQAFEEIVRRHSRRVFSFLHQFTRHRQDAEDLTQQTFIKAYQNLHRFDCRRPLINWLLTIARRSALNHFRSAKKWEEVPESAACAAPSPAHRAEERDETSSLWERARRVLSPREFEVLWLRFAEELSTEETAQIAGITQTHVKVLVYRARQQLLKGAMPS